MGGAAGGHEALSRGTGVRPGTNMGQEGVDHAKLAASLNGRAWSLLEKAVRTEDETEEMVHAAHASLWHWLQAGTAVHRQRGEWLVARAHLAAGHLGMARRYAERAAAMVDGAGFADFDRAYASELVARVLAAAGETEAAAAARADAVRLGRAIAGPEDRDLFFADLSRGPWFGLDERAERIPQGRPPASASGSRAG